MMTYGDIVNLLAQQGKINSDDAKRVAEYYWRRGIIGRTSSSFTIQNNAYSERSMIQRVMVEARKEVVE